jgi:hypothetical protein
LIPSLWQGGYKDQFFVLSFFLDALIRPITVRVMHFQLSDALRKPGLQQLVLVMKLSDFIGPFMQPRTFAWKRDFVQSKQDALLTWAIGYSLAFPYYRLLFSRSGRSSELDCSS